MAKTTHVIVEVDRDYHTVTDVSFMDFESDDAANKYATKESWTGYRYSAYPWDKYFGERKARRE